MSKIVLCLVLILTPLLSDAQAAERELIPVVPLWPPWYYDPFLYPAPPPQRRRAPPPPEPEVTPQPALPTREPSYWYCLDAKVYYPEVTRCPGGWQQVVPRNPPPPPSR
jgi:hypothetical protein